MYKWCIFVFGLGGFFRECVGFEVCDVYYFYYGCLCIIEILEGLNIGLIFIFCVYVKVNKMGFFEIFYWKVIFGFVEVKLEFEYLLVEGEDFKWIVQVNVLIMEKGVFEFDCIKCCEYGDFFVFVFDEIEYMDVVFNQIVGVLVFMIFFLENDDVNCVFMGLNMQCQAVLLLCLYLLVVGIGLEGKVVCDFCMLINVEGDGVVEYVDVNEIIICYDWIDEE